MTATTEVDVPDGTRPHPWNTGFRWEDHPTGTTLSAAQLEQFDRDGYVVVEDVVDAATLAEMVAAIDAPEARMAARLAESGPVFIADAEAITFTAHLVVRSEVLRRFASHPTLLGFCADLVGPDVNLYWDQAVYKKPEKPRRFPWHQDNGYAYVEPQQYLTCWVALVDATVENGCPQVVPGHHRAGTLAHRYVDPLGWECFSDPPQAVPAPVRAGGVVVFSSLTPHLTGPNTTDDVRKAYIVQYAPAGAVVLEGDPAEGAPRAATPADAPDTRFPVLRDGRPVEVPALGPVPR